MNDESVSKTRESARADAVIKPWLSAGLVIALAGNVIFSATLIVKLSGFDDMKIQAIQIETEAAQKRIELSSLQSNVESLNKQKEALAPTVADWEKRLKEKAAAEAVLATFEEKIKQAELDIAQAVKRLEESKGNVLDSERQKTALDAAVQRIRSELASLTITNIDLKSQLTLAADAERRLSLATNGLAEATARRVQLDEDINAAQARFVQLQKDSDDLRQTCEKSNAQATTLRQQIQSLKDQLTTFNQQAVELTNRLVQARSQTTEWENNRDTSQQAGIKVTHDLAVAQRLLAETQASQVQLAREQAQLITQIAASKKDLEQLRNDAAAAETHFDSVKADSQKAEADVSAARTMVQEFSAKHGELTREVSRLEAIIEGLKKQKEALEKQVGRLEGQKPAPSGK